ncbi:MAG: amidohydrolase [Halanaerobium sp.]|nr:amidohydrolase [Halanaerobium sp.]
MKLFSNGRIYPLEGKEHEVGAILFAGNRIAAIGERQELIEYARCLGGDLQEYDLAGRCALPGFIDSHTHFRQFSLNLRKLYFLGQERYEDILEGVRNYAQGVRPGDWILGQGWNKNIWDKTPRKEDLDQAAPENPVALYSKDYHTIWANSLALAKAGIDTATPDPEGGKFVRDEEGRPTGIVRENAAKIFASVIPEPTLEESCLALAEGFEYAWKRGLTGIHVSEGSEAWNAYQYLRRSGKLGLRVLLMIPRLSLDNVIELGIRSGLGDEFIRVGPLKLFVDGALGSQTAAMFEPYCGSDDRGIQVISRKELEGLVRRAAENGIASAIHAIGDKANHLAINALYKVKELTDRYGLRQRVEHLQLVLPEDIALLHEASAIASMQPIHLPGDIANIKEYWGGRAKNSFSFRRVLQAGIPLAFGSDVPVEDLDPLRGIWAAVARKEKKGGSGFHPEESLTVMEAVKAFTLGSAYASGEETIKGSLVPGKLADMVVLDRDIFRCEPDEILDTRVDLTILDGQIVYDR